MLTYAIGDVHGCIDKLERLLAGIAANSGGRPARVVFIGDYIDRGPDSRAVVERLIGLQHERRGDVVCLRGNHEEMAVAAFGGGTRVEEWWLDNGGAATLASYRARRAAELPTAHRDWFQALALFHDDGQRYFVHAGIRPGVPLDLQDPQDLVWIREPFLSSADRHERFIVHGHTPLMTARPDLRPYRLNIDTGAVYGGPLTAAVFIDEQVEPVAFLNVE